MANELARGIRISFILANNIRIAGDEATAKDIDAQVQAMMTKAQGLGMDMRGYLQ